MKLTYALCTYNRCNRLERLIAAMRSQTCPITFEILAINNNSSDATLEVLGKLAAEPGVPLRCITETRQGIVPARNRAVEEALDSDILVFIDDDELPLPGLLEAVHHAIRFEGAACVGGRIKIDFSEQTRPPWLDDEIAAFLGELDYARDAFWIIDASTPVWSGNVAYDMKLFRQDPTLRFDLRYNREGEGVGGGEDAMMFRTLLSRSTKIRYRRDMAILHAVEPWKLERSYFLKLHFRAGLRYGAHQLPHYPRTVLGVPPFLVSQFVRQGATTLGMMLSRKPGTLRQGMNAAHTLGCMISYRRRSPNTAEV